MSPYRKPTKHSKEEGDELFWVKIALIGVVVVILSVFAGNWLGRYLVGKGLITKATPFPVETAPPLPTEEPSPTPEKIAVSPSPSPSVSPSPTPTASASASPSPSPSPKAKPSPSASPTPKASPSPSPTPSPSPSPKPSPKPTPTPSPRPTRKPAPSPTTFGPKSAPTPSVAPTATAAPQPSPKPTASPAPSRSEATPEGTSYVLHVGSFMADENLQKVLRELKDMGYSPTARKVDIENQTYTRVELGPYSNRKTAEEEAGRLEAKGFSPRILPRQE